MDILITILIIIAAVVGIFFIIPLFVKKEYSLQRQVIINKPKRDVFNYVKYLKNQDNYSKWVMADPNKKTQFKGTDGTLGFVYAWDSTNKNVGRGEQEIKEINEGENVNVEIRFIKPFEGIAIAPMITESLSGNQTRVSWGMKGKSKYPMNFMNLFMDKMIGRDLETSLATLKNILEK